MTGLAPDGGLLVPESIPDVRAHLADWQTLSYQELAFEVFSRYIDDISADDLRTLIDQSYSTFDHKDITPVVPLGDDFILELFHGPTLAFKDVALQLLGNLFAHILGESGGHLNIVGATSGDTGSAAIEGVRGKQHIKIFIMFPEGKTSPVQERQMTSVLDDNVFNLAVEGSFDDCQRLLKQAFSDQPFKEQYALGAVNSVNWARVMAQIVYYFYGWSRMGAPAQFDAAVPTGNFGNIFAGYLARHMGLPIRRLVLASNSNDILPRFFATGIYKQGSVNFTQSPAMDIQVSSNFERYLYFKLENDGEKVRQFMADFLDRGKASLPFNTRSFDDVFVAGSATDEATLAALAETYRRYDYLADPHTAVGLSVGAQHREPGIPMLFLSTAHPAKFDDAITRALPDVAATHPSIEALADKPTRKVVIDADLESLKAFIAEKDSTAA